MFKKIGNLIKKTKEIPGYICYRFEDETDDNSEIIRKKMINAIRINLSFLEDTKEINYWKAVYFIPRDYQINLSFLKKLDMVLPIEATFKDKTFEGIRKAHIENIKTWSEYVFKQLQDKIELKAKELERIRMEEEKRKAKELSEKFEKELKEKEAAKLAKAAERERLKFEEKMKKMMEKANKK